MLLLVGVVCKETLCVPSNTSVVAGVGVCEVASVGGRRVIVMLYIPRGRIRESGNKWVMVVAETWFFSWRVIRD